VRARSARIRGGPLDRAHGARALAACLACVGLAAFSLLIPTAPTTDSWGWILWGRELVQPDYAFSTKLAGPPSWKPLPVLATAPLSLAGSAAPKLWVLCARSIALLGLLLAFRLAGILVGAESVVRRSAAGVIAVVGLVVSRGWIREFSHGYSEPIAIALLLGAIQRHLAGRQGQALLLGAAVSAARPEAFPLLVVYAGLMWWRSEVGLTWVALTLAVVPELWLIPDWIGAGDPFYGSRLSRQLLDSGGEPLSRALYTAPVPLSLAAIGGTALAAWQRDREFLEVAGLAALWFALLGLMMAGGYPAYPRFFDLPAGVLCVVGAAGVVRLVGAPRRPWLGAAGAAGVLAVLALSLVPRAKDAVTAAEKAARRARVESDLWEAVTRGGGAKLRRCGLPALPRGLRWTTGLVAWRLELPIPEIATLRTSGDEQTLQRLRRGLRQRPSRGAVTVRLPRKSAVLFLPYGDARLRLTRHAGPARAERLASFGQWSVYTTNTARCRRELASRRPYSRRPTHLAQSSDRLGA
jgi:hypothetical protein